MAVTTDSPQPSEPVDLAAMVGLFYPADPERLAEFRQVPADELPTVPRQLLDHDEHMTITVEAFHGSAVAVKILRSLESTGWYAREILLTREDNGSVVQYGIVRLRPDLFQPDVWSQIREGRLPLGRVLIRHNVFRKVERIALWKVISGPRLAELLQIVPKSVVYGRTARIICDHAPAIELLEIVVPSFRS